MSHDETIQKLMSVIDRNEIVSENSQPTLSQARVLAPAGSSSTDVALVLNAARDGENRQVTVRTDADGMRALGESLIEAADSVSPDDGRSDE
ncbi:hypothetical protein ACFQDG_00570 [Natronoarchaeum mannanilyticum]|uniref:Uncharacterized protein n=1 Tax=Natronoarchaeum mannanilyticum TaxID=926360 RepID=A0AAV3TES1_9EURY